MGRKRSSSGALIRALDHPLASLLISLSSHEPPRLSPALAQADQFEAERLLARGEALLSSKSHPDVYKVPYRPGGTLYARNPPVDARLHQEFDFGREAPN